MKKYNVLIPKTGTRHVGFSPIGSEAILVITNKIYGKGALMNKVDIAASSLEVSTDEILNKLSRTEEVRWPPTDISTK